MIEPLPTFCSRQNSGVHTNEDMVFNRAGMYAGAVSDGNIVADDAGEIIGDVKAYQILYIGTFAYGNIVNITSCDNTGPKAGVSAYTHIAGKEYAGVQQKHQDQFWDSSP